MVKRSKSVSEQINKEQTQVFCRADGEGESESEGRGGREVRLNCHGSPAEPILILERLTVSNPVTPHDRQRYGIG
jgi:hypothetical protein